MSYKASSNILEVIKEARLNKSEIINLGNLELTVLPEELFELTHLKAISLGQYYHYPSEGYLKSGITTTFRPHVGNNLNAGELRKLTRLPQLHDLHLNNLLLNDLSFLNDLTNLKYLSLNGSQHADFSPISNLRALSYLSLSEISLSPTGFLKGLSNLDTLVIDRSSLDNLRFLLDLPNLVFLSMEEVNFFGPLGDELEQVFRTHGDWKIKKFNCSSNKVTHCDFLKYLPNVVDLSLENSSINFISKDCEFEKLENLNLARNSVIHIDFLSKSVKLRYLDLSDNPVIDTSILVGKFYLQTLNLSNCKIVNLDFLLSLYQLENLYLSGNPIDNIDVILVLKGLKSLSLTSISYNLSTDSIERILQNNLKLSNIYFNPSILPEGIAGDVSALRLYFKKLRERDSVLNRSLKIVLMGNSKAGKSQFLNYLINQKFDLKSKSTHGLQINDWNIEIEDEQHQIRFFDFGGQDYYHSTHNLFLDKQALYITFWHIEDETDNSSQNLPLNYWLGNISNLTSAGEDSDREIPIMIVQSRGDDENNKRTYIKSSDIEIYNLKSDGQYYLSVKEAANVDTGIWKLEWEYFFNHLKFKIKELSLAKPRLTHEMLKVKDSVLKMLREEGHLVMRKLDFINKCNEIIYTDGGQREYRDTLLFLHSSGDILWYHDRNELEEYIVVNPTEWSEFIFEVFELDMLSFGEFSSQRISDVLNKRLTVYFPDIEFFFISLLVEFRIIFLKPSESNVYVVPQFLKEQRLEVHLNKLIKTTFVIQYEDYMPHWRMSNYISKKGSLQDAEFWRDSILYVEGNCSVLLRINRTNNQQKIYLHVEGAKSERIKVVKEVFDFFTLTEVNATESTEGEYFGYNKVRSKNDLDSYIKRINLSVDDVSFFAINDILSTDGIGSKYLKSKQGTVLPIPGMFYPILNIENMVPKRIFFSYSHIDAKYRRELDVHFAALKRNKYVETWHDMEIVPGSDWEKTILEQIELADIVLLLISPDFMNSSYIWEKEIPRSFSRIVPIFLRPCDFDETIISPVQGLPKHYSNDDGDVKTGIKWIVSSKWQYIDEAYLAVVEGLKELIRL